MDDFHSSLNEVFRYADESERAAFEKNIDNAPHDATNHLVYADWLDDAGEHDEAAFRRSMGEWIQQTPPHRPIKWSDDYAYPWTVETHSVPKGIHESYIPRWDSSNPDQTQIDPDSGINGPVNLIEGRHQGRSWRGTLQWKTYRHMEEALRQAFHASRKSQS